jgi:hypothetical protein
MTRSRWAEEHEEPHEHFFACAVTDTTGEPIIWVCECGAYGFPPATQPAATDTAGGSDGEQG